MADDVEINSYKVVVGNNGAETFPEKNVQSSISYDDFFVKFLVENRPCVFNSDITRDWRCRQEWDVNGAPNFKILQEYFGNCEAPVADCEKKYYNSQFKDDTKIANFLNYWIEYRHKKYPPDMKILYLKDWHCAKKYPNLGLYSVPKFFASDWLNEFFIAHPELDDDYMFVYMGPKGTWTPFHADVFTSYSWSANIVGKKKWLLFPPGEENNLRDHHGQLIFDATSFEELKNSTKYPNYDDKNLKSFEIIQEAGEVIFVPSGWYHQVWNLEDTISVNHNWINGCNVWNSWMALENELSAVMREVEDCRDMDDWEKHCQVMLKASHGTNYTEFYDFLSFIVKRRLESLREIKELRIFEKWKIGSEHCLFDIQRAKIVIDGMIEDTREKKIHDIVFPDDQANDLIEEISNLLSSKLR